MEYKLSVGTGLKRQCLPVAREADKASARKYILARKDAKGKKTYGYRRIGRRLARNGIYYTLKTVLRVVCKDMVCGAVREKKCRIRGISA